jgi:hypothetical protein
VTTGGLQGDLSPRVACAHDQDTALPAAIVNIAISIGMAFWPATAIAVSTMSVLVASRNFQNAWHIDRLAVQVHRHDRLGARGDGGVDRAGVDAVGRRVHVDEHRGGADRHDRQHGGDKGIGRCDDLVARPDLERPQRQLDRGQPGADADGVARADVAGVLGLEALDRRAQDEVTARDEVAKRTLDRFGQRRVLRAKIDERHRHRCDHFFSPRPR